MRRELGRWPHASRLTAVALSLALVGGTAVGIVGPVDEAAAAPALGTTVLVSADGTSTPNFDNSDPAVSANGNIVVYRRSDSQAQIVRRDVDAGTEQVVSSAPGGAPGDAGSASPRVSADGCIVAFESSATNLVAGDTNGTSDIFVRDSCTAGAPVRRVSVTSAGAQANGDSISPALSADGSTVAFLSHANDLTSGDTGWFDLFVHKIAAGTTTFLSPLPASITPGATHYTTGHFFDLRLSPQSLTDDGSQVVFHGSYGAGGLHSAPCTGTYERWAVYATSTAGPPARALSTVDDGCDSAPVVAADGSAVIFRTPDHTGYRATTLAGGASVSIPVVGAGQQVSPPRINADGARIGLATSAALDVNDLNGVADAYVVDWPSGPKRNTVQLGREDGGDGWAGGLGPVGVVGAFDVPLDVLAFDEARVGAVASGGVEPLADQDDDVAPAVVSALRGKNRAPLRLSGARCVGR